MLYLSSQSPALNATAILEVCTGKEGTHAYTCLPTLNVGLLNASVLPLPSKEPPAREWPDSLRSREPMATVLVWPPHELSMHTCNTHISRKSGGQLEAGRVCGVPKKVNRFHLWFKGSGEWVRTPSLGCRVVLKGIRKTEDTCQHQRKELPECQPLVLPSWASMQMW